MIKSFLTQRFSRVTSNSDYSLLGSGLGILKTQFVPHSSPEWIHSRGHLRLIANLKAFHRDAERRKQSAGRPSSWARQCSSRSRWIWSQTSHGRASSDTGCKQEPGERLNAGEASNAAALTLLEAELRWGWNQLIHFSFNHIYLHRPPNGPKLMLCEGLIGCC